MIKLVVSDMDGTLLNKNAQVSIKNREAIYKLKENGVEFAIASGRDYSSVQPILSNLNIKYEAILGNGAQYVDEEGKILKSSYLNKEVYKDIVKVFDEANLPYMVFTTNGFYATKPEWVRDMFIQRGMARFGTTLEDYQEGGAHYQMPANDLKPIGDVDEFLNQDFEIIKVESFHKDETRIPPAKELLKDIPTISYLSSFADNVEVCDQNAQKGLILKQVAAFKGLKEDEIAVLGDGMNDITLFQGFKYSFAPENAEDEIKKLAYQVVRDCHEDGFSEAIDIILKMNQGER